MDIVELNIRAGDIIAFRGKGPIFTVLSGILALFEKGWRKRNWKPWHLAVASRKVRGGWMLIEAVVGGVQDLFHSTEELEQSTRAYHWLDKPPSRKKIEEFKSLYLGYPYDASAYIGITFAYLFWKVTKKSFRVIDTEHLCWETVAAFCRFMGKPLQPIYEYPIITRIISILEENKNEL